VIKLIVSIFLVFFWHGSTAQKFSDSLYDKTTFLRFNPLGLADFNDVNLSFGVEKKITKKSSVALDASFVFHSQSFRDISNRSRGFILRPAYRFFPSNSKFLLEIQLHYKQVTHRMTDWVGPCSGK